MPAGRGHARMADRCVVRGEKGIGQGLLRLRIEVGIEDAVLVEKTLLNPLFNIVGALDKGWIHGWVILGGNGWAVRQEEGGSYAATRCSRCGRFSRTQPRRYSKSAAVPER